ncbi:MAG: DEAD/DEAH box helicase [Blautia sp.]|nr:DEAD/DEAH box helicase [Blautia sp.]
MADSIQNTARWRWESYLPDNIRQLGRKDANEKKVIALKYDKENGFVSARTIGGFSMFASIPDSYESCINYEPWYSGLGRRGPYYYENLRYEKDKRFSCTCSAGENSTFCRHLASMMYALEMEYGPVKFVETPEEREARIKEEQARAIIEKAEKEKKKKQDKVFPAIKFIKPYVPQDYDTGYFDPGVILGNAQTNQYENELAEAGIKKNGLPEAAIEISYNRKGEQNLEVFGAFGQDEIYMTLGQSAITKLSCFCDRAHGEVKNYWGDKKGEAFLCCHALAFYAAAWNLMNIEKPGDATDRKASMLLQELTQEAAAFETIENVKKKEPDIELIPKITVSKDTAALQLSFTIGRTGERPYVVKNVQKMLDAAEAERVFELSKKASVSFSEETFTEESQRWYSFLESRKKDIDAINRRLSRSFYYTPTLSVGNTVPLEGSDLDLIYDNVEGKEILYQASSKVDHYVKAGPGVPRAEVSLDPVRDKKGNLTGIMLTGSMPRLLTGGKYSYILDDKQFGRVSEDEMKDLLPFRSIADKDGNFSCQIGIRKFPEFYFRVLPGLRDSGRIILHDNVGDIDEDLLPAEPEFVFYIDKEADALTCRVSVRYGEVRFSGGFDRTSPAGLLRDTDQEKRVINAVESIFEQKDLKNQAFTTELTEEKVFRLLTEGTGLLSQYGEVKGSEAFSTVKLRKVSMPKFSVEIEGGLLELSVHTRDMTSEELLELLGSYKRKKRWHRLKSGDYVDLRQAEGLEEMENLSEAMDLSLEDLVRGDVRLPKFRALYVDRLLEGHDEIATARDRHFKALVRSFRTIRDSDFDVPEQLQEVVRPYQQYGFRWLSTLSEAGFGGILADEMGLGKTLQMLAFLKSKKDGGEDRPALVVCPASLVYNWKEENSRFTEDLIIELLAGPLAQRKESILKMTGDEKADLYVTSYDLLKRDIALYQNVFFSTIVLDEAQYIKNQKAAVTKAVKVLNAERRFAMTGTPIENRLSELWSIFDFLMPGFLYNASEFGTRFEGPIMKKKDEAATAKLSKMTAPFILRRKKTDVLKDLPEKLEEIQAQVMETDQRRLYDAQVVHMRKMLTSFTGSGEEKIRILAEITRLRQLCCDPALLFDDYKGSSAKREACIELIERAIDGGHRMLVFSQFTSMFPMLSADLKEKGISFYTLTGSTPKKERIRLVNEFNNGDVPVFLISLKAGGTGLNLTGADVVIHYDPWWNLAVQNQATDRAHRIGQTRQVTVIKLIAADTIEEKIIKLQEAKKDLADAIMGGEGSLMSMTREELLELLD